jgi:hypothetical protein
MNVNVGNHRKYSPGLRRPAGTARRSTGTAEKMLTSFSPGIEHYILSDTVYVLTLCGT